MLGCATHSRGRKRQRRLGFTLKCLLILASPPAHWHPGLRFGLSPTQGVQNLFAPWLSLLSAVVCKINIMYKSCALATNGVKKSKLEITCLRDTHIHTAEKELLLT